MKTRAITPLLIIGCFLMLAVGGYVLWSSDRSKPEILMEEQDISYDEGQDISKLLEGVTAEDKQDGDLTDQVFVLQLVKLQDEKQAMVTYGVQDSSHNVATARRIIQYTGDGNLGSMNTGSNDGMSSTDDNSDSDPGNQDYNNPQAPVITLEEQERTIAVGGSFNPSSIISEATDDIDSRSELFRHIHLDGTYDVNREGSYPLTIYVTDTNGNKSNVEEFTLIIKKQ